VAVLVTGIHEFSPKLAWSRNIERRVGVFSLSILLHRKSKEGLIKKENSRVKKSVLRDITRS